MINVGWWDVLLLVVIAVLIGAGMIVAYWQGLEAGREEAAPMVEWWRAEALAEAARNNTTQEPF